MLNKGQKLVRMVELLTRRGGIPAEVLVERLELDARTLRRYLADLRELDIPVRDEGRGPDRVLSIDPRWRRTGVQLSLSEVLSLHFGRTLFNFLEGTRFAEDLDGALERLEPAISQAHQDLARQLDARFLAVPEPSKDYRGASSEILDDLVTALVYDNPVDAVYRKANGAERRVHLRPYTLATFRQGLYLLAWESSAQTVKTWAVERFLEVVRLRGQHFRVPPDWDPRRHLAHAFGIIDGPPQRVALSFHERVGAYLRERTWHASQRFRTLPDGQLELTMFVAVTVELQTWILSFGADVRVLHPPELADSVRDHHQRAAAAP